MRIQEVSADRIRLSDGQAIPWDKVNELKVFNDTLRFVLSDRREIEVGGLGPGEVDRVFRSYSHFRWHRGNSPQ
jgi:hypothetical protein